MLNKNGERELAYIVKIDKVEPHPNADRLDIATVIGWHIVTGKGDFEPGDLAIYFEVDSQLPDKAPFSDMEFLKSKHFKIKCQKIRGIVSQGLLMPASAFNWKIAYTEGAGVDYLFDETTGKEYREGDFLTKDLDVIYNDPLDNIRKAPTGDLYASMKNRHGSFFRNAFIKKLMHYAWFRKLMLLIFGSKVKKKTWPNWVIKTDEERVQNLLDWDSNYAGSQHWVATEKIDGTSATFTIRRTGNLIGPKYEYYVCSRNVVFDKPGKKCFYDTNVYTEISKKYNIESHLINLMEEYPEYKFITLQGEIFGNKIQTRNYSMPDYDIRMFNYITSMDGRWDSVKAANYWEGIFPWVPILDTNFTLPKDRDELITFAHGDSQIDQKSREGIVFRSSDGKRSFKVVDPEFILKYHNT